jgi:hypothetical protein
MRISWTRIFTILGLTVTFLACGEEPAKKQETAPAGLEAPPLGAWLMYGGGQGVLRDETFNTEVTELVLADSVYSLTFKRPDINFVYVESGKVYYDLRAKIARFTVMTTSGVDWSSGVPRKLMLIPESVPFQRDPGTRYGLEYVTQDSLLSLSGEETEATWFVRVPQ